MSGTLVPPTAPRPGEEPYTPQPEESKCGCGCNQTPQNCPNRAK